MKIIFPSRIAEIFFALVIAGFGLLHYKYANDPEAVPDFMPGKSVFWMYLTGTAFILASLSIVLNKYKKLGCYLLCLMIGIFVIIFHGNDLLHLKNLKPPLKDIGLAMAAILIGNSAKK